MQRCAIHAAGTRRLLGQCLQASCRRLHGRSVPGTHVAGMTGDRNRRCRIQIGLQASKFVPACKSNRNKCRMQQDLNPSSNLLRHLNPDVHAGSELAARCTCKPFK